MNVRIVDDAFLESIKPERLKYYLDTNGWIVTNENLPQAKLYGKNNVEVCWMANNRLYDYARRMGENIEAIAHVEQVSTLEIVTRLAGVNLGNKYKLVRETGNLRISLVVMND